MTRFFVLFCCLLLTLDTSLSRFVENQLRKHNENLIVGGVETDISNVPYQAALLVNDNFFCGATIISEKFLITGAHCILFFYMRAQQIVFARVGSNFSEKDGTLMKMSNATCHSKFDFDNYDYDICIIELEESLRFNEKVRPVKIANEEPREGAVGRVAGWGTLTENGKLPEKLQSVLVPVTNKTFCEEVYQKISPVTERMFCAGIEGKDSCQGDSGGGLIVRNQLVGVISTGFGCGLKNSPGVYTSVAHPEIREFVKDVTGI